MAINAGHKQIIDEITICFANCFSLKETDVCKSYHINIFLDVVRTNYPKVSDFGMSHYSTNGWHSNYYSGKATCDIE